MLLRFYVLATSDVIPDQEGHKLVTVRAHGDVVDTIALQCHRLIEYLMERSGS